MKSAAVIYSKTREIMGNVGCKGAEALTLAHHQHDSK